MRLGRTLASGLFGAALVVGFAASPASAADGVQRTSVVGGSGPNSQSCGISSVNATACFEPYGEWFWLKDEDADGLPVAINWSYSNPGYPDRSGVIYNDHGKAAGWTNLNKSFAEEGLLYYEACEYNVRTQELSYCSGLAWART